MDDDKVCIRLDSDSGVVYLSNLQAGTMVYLYDANGDLCVKLHATEPVFNHALRERGFYILVLNHPFWGVIVRRIIY